MPVCFICFFVLFIALKKDYKNNMTPYKPDSSGENLFSDRPLIFRGGGGGGGGLKIVFR